jgi:ATP:corrinoid adenosyltransferase
MRVFLRAYSALGRARARRAGKAGPRHHCRQRRRRQLGVAIVDFTGAIGKGFSPSAFGNAFRQEISDGCSKQRNGQAAVIQDLARCVVKNPDHRGVAAMLRHIEERKATADPVFDDIELDSYSLK